LKELPTINYYDESCTTFFLLKNFSSREDGQDPTLDAVVLET
jgi:hypothetical protein